MAMELTSHAFVAGGMIPATYTCDGEDISPELMWQNAPKKTKSFALIVNDPDAPQGNWFHWIIFNIPATTNVLPIGTEVRGFSAIDGINSWGQEGYKGPCPPSGIHHYFFTLYALDTTLQLTSDATKDMLETAMQGHILDRAELVGRYQRK